MIMINILSNIINIKFNNYDYWLCPNLWYWVSVWLKLGNDYHYGNLKVKANLIVILILILIVIVIVSYSYEPHHNR